MAKIAIDLARLAPIVAKASPGTDLLAGDDLLLAREKTLSVHWAPFDYVPPTARLAIVGITPGYQQAVNALTAFQKGLRSGADLHTALREAKLAGSFSGRMRGNLVSMLNAIGAHHTLGIADCADLFDPAHERVHFTSALRYPVFVDGANYNGNPAPLRTPLLRGMVEDFLAEEVRQLSDALWLPLGPKPAAALRHLVSLGLLPVDRVLEGLPHPSPASQERVYFFLDLKARAALSSKTLPEPIERARDTLIAQLLRLRSA